MMDQYINPRDLLVYPHEAEISPETSTSSSPVAFTPESGSDDSDFDVAQVLGQGDFDLSLEFLTFHDDLGSIGIVPDDSVATQAESFLTLPLLDVDPQAAFTFVPGTFHEPSGVDSNISFSSIDGNSSELPL